MVIVDGEHYAPVVRAALAELPYDVVAAVMVGGTEKLLEGADYGVPLVASLEEALDEHAPELVFDLSDEPVLSPPARLRLASRALARGVPYAGPDFRFAPPELAPFSPPSIAIVGTGKRVGKTAVTGHAARLLARDRRVVVVAMGRGGPEEPEVVETPPTVESLVELARGGRHAASDHLETALVAGVPTVGCRRAGGGLAGAVAVSNVLEGARLAEELGPDLVVFDGSGAAIPPIAAGRRVLVVGGGQAPDVAAGYLNAFRILTADLVVVTMAEGGHEPLVAAVRELTDAPLVATVLRPRPLEPVDGCRVAFFGTAEHPAIAQHLRDACGADVVYASGSLADRKALRAELERVDADVYVVELKAAAVDVVAEAALERGVRVVPAAVDVLPLPGEPDLDRALLALAATVAA